MNIKSVFEMIGGVLNGIGGVLVSLVAIAMVISSNKCKARLMISIWPKVIGSKVPGYKAFFIY